MLDLNSLSTWCFNAVDIPDLDKRGQSYLLEHVLSHKNPLVQNPLLITSELARAAKPSMDGKSLIGISEKILQKMNKARLDVYGESLLAYTFRQLIQIAPGEEDTKAFIFDDANFVFGPALQQQPRRSAKANKWVTCSAPPVAPDVTDTNLEELKRQVRRALSIVTVSPAPEAGPSSSPAAPPLGKKTKLGAPLAKLSGENQSGRRYVLSHGTACLDELRQEGSTSSGGGGKKRAAPLDLVLSSDSEGGNIGARCTVRRMIIFDSNKE